MFIKYLIDQQILICTKKSMVYSNKTRSRKMKKASSLVGKFDFNAFRSSHCQASQSIRSIEKIIIKKSKEVIDLNFVGKHFYIIKNYSRDIG